MQKQVKIKSVAVCLQLYGMSTGTRRIMDSLMWKFDNFSSQGYNHKKKLAALNELFKQKTGGNERLEVKIRSF